MKRLLSTILIITLVLSLVPLTATACEHGHAYPDHKDANCTEDGYDRMICDDCGEVVSETILPALGHDYRDGVCSRCGAKDPNAYLSGTCGAEGDGSNLTWTLDSVTGVLEISGTGDMICFWASAPWYSYRDSITSVVIGSGVTSIGNKAFEGCSGLTNISLPDCVTSIGEFAFRWCSSIKEISIPEGVPRIEQWTFAGCSNLTSVIIPNSVTSIGNSAFLGCSGLTSITVPDSVTSIEEEAFSECTGLRSITLGNGLYEINYKAFEWCKNLKSVSLPDSVMRVRDWSFHGCSSLTSVTFGKGVISIGDYAFKETGLTGIVIPDNVKRIGEFAFCDCRNMSKVTIGNGVTRIGTGAFSLNRLAGLVDVYYRGTKAEWEAIQIEQYNDVLTSIHYLHEPIVFNDVKETAWYYDAANYTVSNGLMNGVGNNNFAPDSPMTRAMLVTVLWRYENCPKEGENTFTDVPNGKWYTDAVAWAAANGIVGGVGNGKFDPNGNITREQMAAILYRYANEKGFDTDKRGDLSGLPDATKVSTWAKDAIAWAVGEGIIGGSDGKLLPQGNATRAQVATILMRFIKKFA